MKPMHRELYRLFMVMEGTLIKRGHVPHLRYKLCEVRLGTCGCGQCAFLLDYGVFNWITKY